MKTNSLSAWILAIRPYSLGNSVILILIGSALAFTDGGFRPVVALLCLVFAVTMQCTANLVNDLCDFLKGADRPDRLGPDRAFAKGYITLRAMKSGIAAFTLAACAAGAGLLALSGWNWWLLLVGASCIVFAYFYTAGPWPLAYHGMGDIAVILFFGLIPVGFTYYLQCGGWSGETAVVGLACGMVIDTMLMINNFRLAFTDGGFRPVVALLCLVFAVTMQCTANLVNDLCDFLKGADRPDRLGPDRAFAKGYITLRAMKSGIAAFTLAACAAGAGLLALSGWNWWLLLVGASCIVFAYFYTAGPWPLAYHGMGDIAVILFFGLIPVGFTYYLQCGGWSGETAVVGLACGMVIDTMLMINNFRDREEDRRCNKRTIVVCLGAAAGRWGYLVLGTGAILLCLSLLAEGRIAAALLPLPYLAVHIATWRKMVRIDHGEELNVCLGETARNILLFGALLTAGILLDKILC